MSRLVNGLLVLVGAYVAIFYGLYPPDPFKSVISLPLPPGFPLDTTTVGIISIVVGALALLVGVFGLVRGAGMVASVALAVAGVYLLLLRFLYPPIPATTADIAFSPELLLVWVSLAGGVVAIVAGIVGLVHGQSADS